MAGVNLLQLVQVVLVFIILLEMQKISTYTQTLTTGTWSGGMSSAHWLVKWAQTTNGWGVTEGGSSGSPLFDNNKRVIGTLTGGNSDCSNQSTATDYYGKFSKHWDANGTSNDKNCNHG